MTEIFLKGVGWVLRKLALATTPTILLEKDGDWYKFITESTFKTTILRFKLNEEFDDVKPDESVIKTTMTVEGNKLIQTQKTDKPSTVVREFSETECIMTATYGDVVAVRKYRV